MEAPVSMLKGKGGSKAAIVIAMLIGLAIITAVRKAPPDKQAKPQGA